MESGSTILTFLGGDGCLTTRPIGSLSGGSSYIGLYFGNDCLESEYCLCDPLSYLGGEKFLGGSFFL